MRPIFHWSLAFCGRPPKGCFPFGVLLDGILYCNPYRSPMIPFLEIFVLVRSVFANRRQGGNECVIFSITE